MSYPTRNSSPPNYPPHPSRLLSAPYANLSSSFTSRQSQWGIQRQVVKIVPQLLKLPYELNKTRRSQSVSHNYSVLSLFCECSYFETTMKQKKTMTFMFCYPSSQSKNLFVRLALKLKKTHILFNIIIISLFGRATAAKAVNYHTAVVWVSWFGGNVKPMDQ